MKKSDKSKFGWAIGAGVGVAAGALAMLLAVNRHYIDIVGTLQTQIAEMAAESEISKMADAGGNKNEGKLLGQIFGEKNAAAEKATRKKARLAIFDSDDKAAEKLARKTADVFGDSSVPVAPQPLPERECEAIEVILKKDLPKDPSSENFGHGWGFVVSAEVYVKLAKRGCPENSTKFLDKVLWLINVYEGSGYDMGNMIDVLNMLPIDAVRHGTKFGECVEFIQSHVFMDCGYDDDPRKLTITLDGKTHKLSAQEARELTPKFDNWYYDSHDFGASFYNFERGAIIGKMADACDTVDRIKAFMANK